jgi:hypothetical protein
VLLPTDTCPFNIKKEDNADRPVLSPLFSIPELKRVAKKSKIRFCLFCSTIMQKDFKHIEPFGIPVCLFMEKNSILAKTADESLWLLTVS